MVKPSEVAKWLRERQANCVRIARTKSRQGRQGWLEDAAFFEAAITLVESIPVERVKSRIMGVDDGMRACEKVINAARLFCESTVAEMDELEGTQSASAPAEFILLHEAVQEFDKH